LGADLGLVLHIEGHDVAVFVVHGGHGREGAALGAWGPRSVAEARSDLGGAGDDGLGRRSRK
jgi:hypothetical protein